MRRLDAELKFHNTGSREPAAVRRARPESVMDALDRVRVTPLKDGFGAEIGGVDLPRADAAEMKEVVSAFHRHGAILVRDQKMSPEFTLPGYPNIYILSNKVVDGKPIGAHNDGVGWHTDYSYKAEPVMSTMLYAVEVPPEGSDTLLADCCAAWDALPPERKAMLEGLKLHHSYAHFMRNREWGAMELSPELQAETPDVIHPLIRTHPADGRKALWVSTGTVDEVIGMPNPEGLQLIDELVEWVTQDRFVYRHKWRVGDVLMWDNRCTLHTGTLYDDTKYDRLMHRLWVKGDRPY
jgi:taurine dioxygenase